MAVAPSCSVLLQEHVIFANSTLNMDNRIQEISWSPDKIEMDVIKVEDTKDPGWMPKKSVALIHEQVTSAVPRFAHKRLGRSAPPSPYPYRSPPLKTTLKMSACTSVLLSLPQIITIHVYAISLLCLWYPCLCFLYSLFLL